MSIATILVEVTFLASQFQCGAGADLADFRIQVQEQTLHLGESVVIAVESIDDIYINEITQISNGNCALAIEDSASLWLDYENEVPTLPGYDNQLSLQDLLDTHVGLDTEYHLWTLEIGTTDLESPAADYQDIVLKFDSNQERIKSNIPAD